MAFGYPGGPKVDKLAKEGQANIELPKSKIEGYDFSYSGIKTAVINLNHNKPDTNKADLCASFQKTACQMLTDNAFKAAEELGLDKIVLAGGVAANSYIREEFTRLGEEKDIKVYLPELQYCTDNAAMIAAAGYYSHLAGKKAELDLNAVPNLKIGEEG